MSVGIPSGNVKLVGVFTKDVDLGSAAANTTSVHTVTITGVKVGDFVFCNKPSHSTGLGIVNCLVSAADTVIITAGNFTASPIDAASETYTFLVVRPEFVTPAFPTV